MFVVVCAVHIFAHVSISYWTLTRVLIHAPILSQCHYHILHSLISILHLINIFYALSIYLSFLVCYLLWPIYLRSMCVCLCHQNEKQIIIFIVVVFARWMQRCIIAKKIHWLVFCFIFLWLHILIGWHILFALFAVSGDTKPTMSTITCMSRIHIHLSIWISSNCIFTSFALSSSNALSGTHKSEHFHST